MKPTHRAILLAAAFSAPMAALAQSASVHSAAGVLPGDVSTPIPENAVARSIVSPTTPPPLPGANKKPAPMPVADNRSATTTAPKASGGAGAPRHVASAVTSFDDVLAEEVTIDVVDMRLGDLLDQIAPPNWRVRTQNIDPATLDQRVDLTAQTTRGDVLHELLAQANLTAKPFEGFDTPLLLITRRS